LLVVLGIVLSPDPVRAQEEGAETGLPDRVVAPDECVTEPRAYEEIAAILNLDGDGVPPPPLTPIEPPLGELADAATTAAVVDAARQIIACFNAGDVPRAAAMMTENGVRRIYWGVTVDEENRELARQRMPAPPERRADGVLIRLIAVTDVSVLPDGRVAAFIVINEPLLPPGGPETLLVIFAREGERWLLDDMVDFSIIPLEPVETGAAAP
jgi:hypothetical protein